MPSNRKHFVRGTVFTKDGGRLVYSVNIKWNGRIVYRLFGAIGW
jgi:hypothetical protein